MMAPAHLLLTGATGFVGSALTAELLGLGYSIVAGVRKPTAALPREVRRQVVGDLLADTDWRAALIGIDTVVHLAARVHVMNDKSSNPLAAFRAVNVDATLNLARQAAQSGVKRFIFISSIGVNGAETFSEPFSELSKPQPHSDYALSKFEAEEGLKDICAKSDMEFVIIRPPLVYGSDAPGNFRSLLKFIHKDVPLPLSLVKNKRSMVFLENLVDFIKLCIDSPNAANQIFLIADGVDVSTPILIELLSHGMGKKVHLFPIRVPILKFGARLVGKKNLFQQLCGSLQVDISKAQNLLGWVPPVSVTEGLRRAAQGYLNEKII